MWCAIYKSHKKADMYLYLPKKDAFELLPAALAQQFGPPVFVMMINLAKRSKLAMADINKVKEALQDPGFYLQMPPPINAALETISSKNNKLW
ncbi:MAG: YcgL domain-containing protein [Enterovibrio sp.]